MKRIIISQRWLAEQGWFPKGTLIGTQVERTEGAFSTSKQARIVNRLLLAAGT